MRCGIPGSYRQLLGQQAVRLHRRQDGRVQCGWSYHLPVRTGPGQSGNGPRQHEGVQVHGYQAGSLGSSIMLAVS